MAPPTVIANLQELIDTYVRERFNIKASRYRAMMLGKLKPLVHYFGADRDPRTLMRSDMERFIVSQQTTRSKGRGGVQVGEALSPFTVNSRVRSSRAMFAWAVRQEYLSSNPLDKIKTPRVPKKMPAAVEQASVEQLLAALNPAVLWLYLRDVALIYCLRDTGARIGGLCGAKVDDIDWDEHRLSVTEKGEKTRFVYLTSVTAFKLRLYLNARRDHWGRRCTDALFIGREGGTLTTAGAYQVLKRAARKAGLKGRFNPHSFRHAFARDMLRAGVDLSRVSQLMGHAGIGVTGDFYARWADRELRDAHSKHSPIWNMPIDGEREAEASAESQAKE